MSSWQAERPPHRFVSVWPALKPQECMMCHEICAKASTLLSPGRHTAYGALR